MNVQLYVYDLSRGLARNMSAALLGVQIDAVYHTSIVMGGIEYTYDGGIKTVTPGATHLGPPMQIIDLGQTNLPMDIIMEYLDSLRSIFTAEAYDIWTHNCNNFSNDFATFLLGAGIPPHITNLPQTVLNTPFGRMIKPQIEGMIRSNQQKSDGSLLGITNNVQTPKTVGQTLASVRRPHDLGDLNKLLVEAEDSCAIIFFTSPNCRPCQTLYALYDELAVETSRRATLIMVDTSKSYDIGSKYEVRATPTFVTFLHGEVENRWTGAGPGILRGNLKLLVQMAWPSHPHESLKLSSLRKSGTQPILFAKIPPLQKLKAKMGSVADHEAISGVLDFVASREKGGAAEATLPHLDALSEFLHSAPTRLPPDIMFTIVDLLRVALTDPRFSGYYAEEKGHSTTALILSYVSNLADCPYSLRLVSLQMACNLFSSPLYAEHILGCTVLTEPLIQLITTSLLDDTHHNLRVAAASLSFNIAASNNRRRTEQHKDLLPASDQIELGASLLEAILVEEASAEALKGFLLAFGNLIYCVPQNSELIDLLKVMDAKGTILGKEKLFPEESLIQEVGGELLQHGFE